jgi:ATP-dependent helicase/nuclease subunit A
MPEMPPERVIKFEAAAGSGKTYRLTFEYLKQVIRLFNARPESETAAGDNDRLINSILAITFTNKAANEMKERILEKLKIFSLVARPAELAIHDKKLLEELSAELRLDKIRIIRLAERIIDRIISHYPDFNVKTIDSLMSSIIKVISPDLNLPPDFEIGVDAEEELRGKAAEFIEDLCHKDWDFVRGVLSNIKNTETLNQWYIDEVIIGYLLEFTGMAQYRGIEESGSSREVTERLFRAVDDLRISLVELLSIIRPDSDKETVHSGIDKRLVNASLVSSMADFVETSRNLKRIDPILNKKLFTLEDCHSCFKQAADENFREEFTRRFRETKDRLAGCVLLLSLNRVSHFSQFFSGFLRYWESRRERIFVNEFSRTLRRKLIAWEKSALPYIYLKLSDRFRHFLFDEFQDTSELQFQALTPILEEVLASEEKSSIFLVGDRKQAIYRWRGGNAELMDEERLRRELGILNWLVPDRFTRVLKQNFRSGKNIVLFNNLFWDPANLKGMLENLGTADRLVQKVQVNFESAAQEAASLGNTNEGFVRVSMIEYQKSDAGETPEPESLLVEKCLQIINDLIAMGCRASDIAILVRTNGEGRDMVRFLESRQIQTISDESLYLSSSSLINEIIAFFRFIDYPPDHLSLFTFISGSIFKKRAIGLFPAEMEKFDETELTGISSGIPLYKRCRDLIPETWQNLVDPFLKQAGFSPPYDVFQDLTLKFQLFENFPASTPFFLSFGSILHELEQKDIKSIAALLTEWEKNIRGKNPYTINVSEDENRVRVLTIHKAKGLEFPVVIVPLKGKKSRWDKNLFWDEGDFYHVSKEYARINPYLKTLYLNEIERGFIDELNLLYVALTRAKDALFVPFIYQQPSRPLSQDSFRKFRSFSEIMANHPWIRDKLNLGTAPEEGDSWKECSLGSWSSRTKEPRQAGLAEKYLAVESKKISTSGWQKEFLVFSSSDLFGIEEKRSIERGEAIHRLLSRIERIPRREAIEAVVKPIAEAEKINDKDCRILIRFLEREDVFCFFHGEIEVFNEKDIAGVINDRIEYRRVDRLVLTGNRVMIIDFKTGSNKTEEHVRQISEYLRILEPLFAGKKTECYLLYPDLDVVERV